MTKLTEQQKLALYRIYSRDWNKPSSYLAFRRTVQQGFDCIMVPYCGMWLGIETDGYTHS
jgi:hypothetical protein